MDVKSSVLDGLRLVHKTRCHWPNVARTVAPLCDAAASIAYAQPQLDALESGAIKQRHWPDHLEMVIDSVERGPIPRPPVEEATWHAAIAVAGAQFRIAAAIDRTVNNYIVSMFSMAEKSHQWNDNATREDDLAHAWIVNRLRLMRSTALLGQTLIDESHEKTLRINLTETITDLIDEFAESGAAADTKEAWKNLTGLEKTLNEKVKERSLSRVTVQDVTQTSLTWLKSVPILWGRVNDFKHRSEAYSHPERKVGAERNLLPQIDLAVAVQAFLFACDLWAKSISHLTAVKETFSDLSGLDVGC
jgi:hypothetical protein